MKVKPKTLLLLACLVWSAAGFNILRIGVMAYTAYCSILNFFLSLLVFCVSDIHFWKAGKKAHRQNLFLPGRKAVLFQIF